ncbi:twin-arginine translocase TatA/TatE family subunit [Propionibacteriaceae bacterium Y2011]|uniref:twin-arginine translocase TatA/TatE family subunit n=1 Tax=Microlunatus sp. Y2014 TaxID=3418488 RepID=UPI003B4C1FA2
MEIAIIALVILVLFGGAKLAGLGKSTGRALREFKEETKGLAASDKKDDEVVEEPSIEETDKLKADETEAEVVDAKPRSDA